MKTIKLALLTLAISLGMLATLSACTVSQAQVTHVLNLK